MVRRTPLFTAVRESRFSSEEYDSDQVRVLLEAGARANPAEFPLDGWGIGFDEESTPLHLASKHDADAVRLLLQHGASVDRAPPMYGTALMTAIRGADGLPRAGSYLPAVRLLIQAGADVNYRAHRWGGWFWRADEEGTLVPADMMDHGSRYYAHPIREEGTTLTCDETPLFLAAQHGTDGAAMELLLDAGATVDATCLMTSVRSLFYGNEKLLVALRRDKVPGTSYNDDAYANPVSLTPLQAAHASRAKVRALLRAGADPHASDGRFPSPCQLARITIDEAGIADAWTVPDGVTRWRPIGDYRGSYVRASGAEDGEVLPAHAAWLVLRASAGWSPMSHDCLPEAAREFARLLLPIGYEIARRTGSPTAFVDVWRQLIMRMCVEDCSGVSCG